ncbi:acetamidase/formamidase family protein [Pseudolysinimonas yzui]|uniref:Formamidase n=1 Tax=Pseudolysinimonas yzui TaxID=2708254 RepID=A0A8J3GQM1_9MICO|nr:acetamidase/formamidase family protein [Pseudolysinimonas yzui]GHF16352.1 formamidase [Pseudolysinimonas yzui]
MTAILQPGEGPMRGVYLPADPETVFWGRLPCASDAPVLEVDPGVEVTIDTISHEGVLDDQGSDPIAFFAAHGVAPDDVLRDAVALTTTRTRNPDDGPHVVTGPIFVRGAQPGDLLAIEVVELLPRVPYGVISNRHGRGALPGEFPRGDATVSIFATLDAPDDRLSAQDRAFETPDRHEVGQTASIPLREGAAERVRFPANPFLGTMGVAVPGDERPHSVPPGMHGGNIDINLLTVGSTLYLPVLVPGALAYVGDPHFAQGDGEVALTAMEASLRATLRFRIVPADDDFAPFVHRYGPVVETPEYWVPTGLDEDLRESMKKAVRAAIAFLVGGYDMDEEHAYAYLSAATDFDISQVVDRVTGVHARIRKKDFG